MLMDTFPFKIPFKIFGGFLGNFPIFKRKIPFKIPFKIFWGKFTLFFDF